MLYRGANLIATACTLTWRLPLHTGTVGLATGLPRHHKKYHRGRLHISIDHTSFILCLCAVCVTVFLDKKTKSYWLYVVHSPHPKPFNPNCFFLFTFFILLSMTGSQATLRSLGRHAFREMYALDLTVDK